MPKTNGSHKILAARSERNWKLKIMEPVAHWGDREDLFNPLAAGPNIPDPLLISIAGCCTPSSPRSDHRLELLVISHKTAGDRPSLIG